jgi:hypothetical protein
MALGTALYTESELPQFSNLAIQSFKRGLGHLLTGKDTPEDIAAHRESCLKALRDDDKIRFVKCFDEETGEIVGAAKWVRSILCRSDQCFVLVLMR